MFIKLLDKDLANMIAAGEVVERPASAVKELCENSIDAGASMVTVEIRGGGVRMIQVTDNGCGIHPEDVANAFLRHATSKISVPDDLDHIYTLGFRGEALASIAAVAKVELYTRTAEYEIGCQCAATCGNITEVQRLPGFVGTRIRAEDLFYNTPARMKFLKKASTEAGYVEEAVRKMALSHPEVSFRFVADGKEKLFTPGDGKLENAVFTIYGKDISGALLPVDYAEGGLGVTGLVSNPVYTRKTRSLQIFFVNNRPIISRMLTNALEEACKNLIPAGAHPAGIIKLSIPADTVDVNVHPSKLEVKFSDESKIYKAVYWAVKNALATPVIPQLLDPEPEPPAPQKPKSMTLREPVAGYAVCAPAAEQRPSESAVSPDVSTKPAFPPQRLTEILSREYRPVGQPAPKTQKKPEYMQIGVELAPEIGYNIIGQAFDTYILLQRGEDLIIIDQHAAHEHINYAKLVQQAETGGITVQQLLTPAVVRLEPAEKAFLLSQLPFFSEIGFEIEDFGNHDIAVRGVPEGIPFGEIEGTLTEVAEAAMQNKMNVETQDRQYALYTVACRASIKAGKKLTLPEMQNLADQLFAIDKTVTCPHGRPAWITMERHFIEKQFKRVK